MRTRAPSAPADPAPPAAPVPPGADGAAPPDATGVDGGDADSGAALADLERRIDELIARVARGPTLLDDELSRQRETFDAVAEARAELDRETNTLRDMAMAQMKTDDELLKKWIELI